MSQHVHFLGIGGAGMSPLATILLERGTTVSGCDLRLSPVTERLAALGAIVCEGHHPAHLAGVDLLVVTAAARSDNPEIVAARAQGIPVIKAATLLGRLMAGKFGICVAGTHGKTTTTALIAKILLAAGLDPTCVVGGELPDWQGGGRSGRGPYFVAEADEFDRRFLELSPRLAVVTNVEADHLDYYGTLEAVVEAFRRFVALVPEDGHLVLGGDDPRARSLGNDRRNVLTYGLGEENDWRAVDVRLNNLGGNDFRALYRSQPVGDFRLIISGRHNVANALAALAVADLLGINPAVVRQTLATFSGVGRRFQVKGEMGGILVIDDYAHHPTEIKATLRAARERYPGRRIVAVHQPHTFSRLKALLAEFATAFADADVVVISEVYPARETDTLGVSSRDLVAAMRHPAVHYAADLAAAARLAQTLLRPGDVLLTLGAGDVFRVGEMVLAGQAGNQEIRESGNQGSSKSANRQSGQLAAVLGDRAVADEPMARHTSLGIGGPADLYAVAHSVAELVELVLLARRLAVPCLVLGGQTNILVSDKGIRGLVIENQAQGVTLQAHNDTATLTADSGVPLADLARYLIHRGWAGLEWAVDIPGSVGGAVLGNAGAYGGYIGDALVQVALLDAAGTVRQVPAAELGLGYRTSRLKQAAAAGRRENILLAAEFTLRREPAETLLARAAGYSQRRWELMPAEPSAGSIFKRTAEHPAGWLIEQAGLKGRRSGQAQISPRHANVIVNLGGATAADVRALLELAQRRVQEQFGVLLEPEVELLGEW
jgi:UDP-N-acetylmuramate--L-alanine ligase/UDP-N-acetylenolpyruvoylglucosamine reductase